MGTYCKKVRYINEQYALDFLKVLKRTSKGKVLAHRAYLCEKCLAWHITKSKSLEEMEQEKSTKENVQVLKFQLKEKNKMINTLQREVKQLKEWVKNQNKSLSLTLTELNT